MHELTAYSTFALTMGLVISRPRLGAGMRLSPAVAATLGALALAAFGMVGLADLAQAAGTLYRPLVAIASLMVLGAAAEQCGALDWLAGRAARDGLAARHLFDRVFVLAALSGTVLNNDSTVLFLTPAVVALVRRRWPDRPLLALPFAFAVFLGTGVAPLPMSNPMNLVVASAAGLDAATYISLMVPAALAAWVCTWAVLRLLFRRELADAGAPVAALRVAHAPGGATAVLAIVTAVVAAVTMAAFIGVPSWPIPAIGAALVLLRRRESAPALLRDGISWDTLGFLFAVLVIGAGLSHAGLTSRLASLYAQNGFPPALIGVTSALGSATLNNHPMAVMNLLALGEAGAGATSVLAALVGGDLGPRLLPIGSLAGLLWLAALRRQGVHVGVGRFVLVGAAATLPALAAALAVLTLLG
jgi:arsenical pump membrane protein